MFFFQRTGVTDFFSKNYKLNASVIENTIYVEHNSIEMSVEGQWGFKMKMGQRSYHCIQFYLLN